MLRQHRRSYANLFGYICHICHSTWHGFTAWLTYEAVEFVQATVPSVDAEDIGCVKGLFHWLYVHLKGWLHLSQG